jgi:tripartite ATP-independent transporter DctM subunit
MSVDSFPLLALPFFILAGNLMNNGGITRRLFAFANSLLGSIRGGLSYVAIVSSALFSAMSGSSLANAAALGTIQIKAMQEQNYDKEFSATLVTTAAVLGPIIPPSVIMIVYGVTAGVSIQKMFMGGILPGILFCFLLAVMCKYYAKKLSLPVGEKFSFHIAWRGFKDAVWALLAPVIILGGIFTGIFTATESGAIASVYVLIVGLFIYKDLKPGDLREILLSTAKTTGTILLIAATASVLGFCLSYARLPQSLAVWLTGVIHSKLALLAIFTIVYLFLGCIMEGILMSVGTITPPVGTVMFVICRNTGLSVERYSRVMLPWFSIIIIFCLLLLVFPQIITFLPNSLYG